jgi:membrane associated rhomboid family serine protease
MTTKRRDGLILVVALAAVMWVVEIIDRLDHGGLDRHGIQPRSLDGLQGVVAAPFLHASWSHLEGNTVPFVVLGAVIALGGLARVAAVTVIVVVVGGLGTWLIAPGHTVTIGASGVVFGYAAYLIGLGVATRRLLDFAIGVLVLVVYGTTLWLSLVPTTGVSWQAHVCGAIGGLVAVWIQGRNAAARRPVGPRDPLVI